MAVERGSESQLGVVDEVTYGTFVTPTKFFEFRTEGIERDQTVIRSEAMRAGRFNTARTGAYQIWNRGAGGDIVMEWSNKGFGFWLKHMLGTVGTTGPVDTSAYTHTGTVGSLTGDMFSAEFGRGSSRFRYEGGKIMSWNLATEVGGLLLLTLTCDFENEDVTDGALTSASYPSALRPFSFIQGSLTVGGTATHVRNVSITGNNNLANERYFIRASGLKKEPNDQGRQYTGTATADFEDKTAYNRFVNGTEAALVLLFEGDTISGASKYSLTVSATVLFTGTTPTVGGPEIISQPLPFEALDDTISLAYKTTDATP